MLGAALAVGRRIFRLRGTLLDEITDYIGANARERACVCARGCVRVCCEQASERASGGTEEGAGGTGADGTAKCADRSNMRNGHVR